MARAKTAMRVISSMLYDGLGEEAADDAFADKAVVGLKEEVDV